MVAGQGPPLRPVAEKRQWQAVSSKIYTLFIDIYSKKFIAITEEAMSTSVTADEFTSVDVSEVTCGDGSRRHSQ